MSILAEWCSSGKAKLSDFETDPRFVRLCRVLTKGVFVKQKPTVTAKSEDLSVVMNVAADDEAAKLVGSISIAQMVKVYCIRLVFERKQIQKSLAGSVYTCTAKTQVHVASASLGF